VVSVSQRSLLVGGAYDALGRGDDRPFRQLLDRRVVWRAVDLGPDFETPT
jgi:hypothetical protein